MESKQRYFGMNNGALSGWLLAEDFVNEVGQWDSKYLTMIMVDVSNVITNLPLLDGKTQFFVGTIDYGGESQDHYRIEYLKESESVTLMVDIDLISVDDYLDMMLDNKSVDSYI